MYSVSSVSIIMSSVFYVLLYNISIEKASMRIDL